MNPAAGMRQAIDVALGGRGRVEPNPRVGAVCLQDGRVVGQACHDHYGGPHAEVLALRDAQESGASPDTMIVTLEPCSSARGHAGKKTPPCTEAVAAAGVKTVVFGQRDPDPRHDGVGLERLRSAGIKVVGPVLEEDCAAINKPFTHFLSSGLPWVIAKWAMTLDGKTATRSGDSRWISGEESRAVVHETRAHVDAVIVGYRTALRDDPELTVRHVEGANPVRIVVDPRAALPVSHKLVQTARQTPTWVLVGPDADAAGVAALASHGVEVREVPFAASPDQEPARWLDLRAGLAGF